MIGAVEFDEFRAGDALGDVAAVAYIGTSSSFTLCRTNVGTRMAGSTWRASVSVDDADRSWPQPAGLALIRW